MRNRWYLWLLMLLIMASPQLAMAAVPTISIGNATGAAGTSLTVNVNLTNNGTATGTIVSLGIFYNPTLLSAAPTAVIGAASTAAGKSFSPPNIISVNATQSEIILFVSGGDTPIADGIVASITFPLSSTAIGPLALTFDTAQDEIDNGLAISIPMAATNASIPIFNSEKPVVGTFTVPSFSKTLTISGLTVAATAAATNGGVIGYLITETSTVPAVGDPGWNATAPTSYTTASEGTKTLFAWAKDAAGNVSAAKASTPATVIVDATAPVVGTFGVPATSTTLTISPISVAATDAVGVTGYLVTESATPPLASAAWLTTGPTSYTVTATVQQGVATPIALFAWAKDAVGNVSAAKQGSVTVTVADAVAPVIGDFIVPPTSTSLTVPITLNATDNLGVTGYLVTESDAVPLVTAGWTTAAPTSHAVTSTVPQGVATSVTFFAWAKDAAGNVSAPKTGSVSITLPDTVAPVVAPFTIPATSSSLNIPLTGLSATDNLAVTGYLVTESSTAPLATANGWTATAPTTYKVTAAIPQGVATPTTLFAWAKDAAGNVSVNQHASVTITLTGPTLNFSAATLLGGTSTKNAALTLSGSVAGNGSTVTSLTFAQNGAAAVPLAFDAGTGAFNTAVTLATGPNTLVIVATDAQNNVTTDSRVITLDPNLADLNVTSPAGATSFVKASTLTVAGTIGAPQTTTVTVTLNGAAQTVVQSGDNFSCALTGLVAAPGTNAIVVTATDTVSGVHTQTFSVTSDLTAPALNVTAPADSFATAKSSVLLSGSATDAENITVVVTVDGTPLATQPVLDGTGNFSVTIALPTIKATPKTNPYVIVVTATDQSGNASAVTRNVIRTLPSGNVTDGVSAPTVADVLKVLQYTLQFSTLTADQQINVNVAPLVNGVPSPDDTVDYRDALVILEKVVGNVAW